MKSNSHRANLGLLLVIAIFLFLSTNTPSFSATPISASRLPKASCRIEIGDAHISTSIFKHQGVRVVKVNANSICNVLQSQVTLVLEIYRTGQLTDHLMHHAQTNPSSPSSNGLTVSIQDAKLACVNSISSSYYGIVYAKALIQGRWHYAGRTRSLHIVKLNCGTN